MNNLNKKLNLNMETMNFFNVKIKYREEIAEHLT
jgi:hypothetical protein